MEATEVQVEQTSGGDLEQQDMYLSNEDEDEDMRKTIELAKSDSTSRKRKKEVRTFRKQASQQARLFDRCQHPAGY